MTPFIDSARIVRGQDGALTVALTQGVIPVMPFDLTNASEIAVIFPGYFGPIIKLKSAGAVVVGTPGAAGRLSVSYSGADSSVMRPNAARGQFQDLEVQVSSGVLTAQVNTLALPAVAAGFAYQMIVNGQTFTYMAGTTDTAQTVFAALLTQLGLYTAAPTYGDPAVNVVGVVNLGTLALTSSVPGLGFNLSASNGIVNTPTTANSGTRAVFILRGALDVRPASVWN